MPGVRHAALELGPEGPPMAPDASVDELVEDDVISQVRRHDGQERVELDASRAGGAAPERALAADAQAAGVVAVLAGQGVQARGEARPGQAAVKSPGGKDRLAAAAPGTLDMGQRAPDPGDLGEGDPPRLIERYPPRDRDADPSGGPDGQRDPAGPPGLLEEDGADAVEDPRPGRSRGPRPARPAAGLSPRNRTVSGPTCY